MKPTVRQTDESPERLRELQRKFTNGTATPQEKVSWLLHLKKKAQHHGDDDRVLALVQQVDATRHEETAQATQPLPCPDGSPRQLAWIRTTDVRARRSPARPAPDREAITDLASSIKEQGMLQNLVLGPDLDVIVGEGRRQAARIAGVPYVPALVLTAVTTQERELAAVAADLFARPRLSLQQLARYHAAHRALLQQEFLASGQPAPCEDEMPTVVDLVQSYHHLPAAQQQEVVDLILEGNAARQAIQTTLQHNGARKETTADARTLQQRFQALAQRLAEIEGERNQWQEAAHHLETQLGLAQSQLHTTQDDLTSLAKAASTHTQETSKLTRELRGLRERLAQLRPWEQVAATSHTAEVMSEVVQVIELVCGRLLRTVSAMLDTAHTAGQQECGQVLDAIAAHVTACKRALAKATR